MPNIDKPLINKFFILKTRLTDASLRGRSRTVLDHLNRKAHLNRTISVMRTALARRLTKKTTLL